MANDGYTLCKGFNKIGVDSHLYYSSPTHCFSLPEWEDGIIDYEKLKSEDMPDMSAFKWTRPDWCHPVMNQVGNMVLMTRNFLSDLSDFDLIVGHWPFPNFLRNLQPVHKIDRPYIIYEAGAIRLVDNPNHPEREVINEYKKAPLIIFANVDMQPILHHYGLEFTAYIPLPIDTEKYLPAKHENDHLVFLHPTRHYHAEKGNDRVIAAFAQYVKRNPKAELRMIAWGGDELSFSKMMVYEHNLAGNVTWLPIRGKLDLIKEYQNADAVFGQYVYSATGSTEAEAMSCGKPVCSRMDSELFQYYHGYAPPILNAQEPSQIYEAMVKLEDPSLRSQLGEEGRRWVEKEQSLEVVADYENNVHKQVLDALKLEKAKNA